MTTNTSHLRIIEQTIEFVKKTLADAEAGHDWWHVQRVLNNAILIAREMDVDHTVVELGALLHDIADSKFHDGDEEIGPALASEFLTSIRVEPQVVDHVVQIIRHVSFKNSLDKTAGLRSTELEIVQDADRLDAIGAMGIARTFHFGGFKNNPIHDPDAEPRLGMTKEQYKTYNGTTINHFHEKLLLLKDGMHTTVGKEMALKRHQYMEGFLEQFLSEWNGES